MDCYKKNQSTKIASFTNRKNGEWDFFSSSFLPPFSLKRERFKEKKQ